MANTTVKGKFNVVAENGDVQTIYPKTTGDQVLVDRSSNASVIPNDVANLQHIVNKMGSLALKSKVETSDFTTGTMINSIADLKSNTETGKIADATVVKDIESRVDTLENSNLVTVDELDAGLATKPDTEINDSVTSTSLTWSSKKLSDQLTTLNSNSQLLTNRVDSLSTLQEGSTTGDAELIDIRVGADGITYQTAGKSVRTQFTNLQKHFATINLLDPTQVYTEKYFRFSMGNPLATSASVLTQTANLLVTPIIPVNEGDAVHIRMFHSSYASIAIGDANKKAIEIIRTVEEQENYDFTVPQGGKYIQYCGRTALSGVNWQQHDIVSINVDMPSGYVPYGSISLVDYPEMQQLKSQFADMQEELSYSNPNTAWKGKICAALGSSLTANGGWSDVLKQRFGFSKMYNRGIGGTTLANFSQAGFNDYVKSFRTYTDQTAWDEDRSTVFPSENASADTYTTYSQAWYSSENRINLLPQNTDLVLVDLAVNDYFRTYNNHLDWNTVFNTPQINTSYRQGINPPSYDDKKFGDAFALMVKRIKTRCLNAKIVVWGMLYNSAICTYDTATSTESDGLEKYYQLNDYLKHLCSYFGVYYIDMLQESGINVYNLTEYCEDGIHPYKPSYNSEKGKYAVANVITNHLKNIYPKDFEG